MDEQNAVVSLTDASAGILAVLREAPDVGEVVFNATTGEIRVSRREEAPIELLAVALCKAQAEMTVALRELQNDHLKTSYADLDAVWKAIRKPLTEHELSVVQMVANDVSRSITRVKTILLHTSGQKLVSVTEMPVDRATAQGFMSASTYAKRQALTGMAGIAPGFDDDGNEASGETGGAKRGKRAVDNREKDPAKIPANVIERIASTVDVKGFTAWVENRFAGAALKKLRASLAEREKVLALASEQGQEGDAEGTQPAVQAA